MDVSGTVSEASYAVWANGVEATVNGDGTWTASSVPVNEGGTAVIQATAYPPGEHPGSAEGGKAVAAIENNWGNDASAFTLGNRTYKDTISQYLRSGVRPVCPTGPDSFYNGVSENATCTSGLAGHELP